MYFHYHIPHFPDLCCYHVDYSMIDPSKIVRSPFYQLFIHFKMISYIYSPIKGVVSTLLDSKTALFWNIPKCLYFLALSSSNETSSSGCTILEFALDETIFPTGCPTAPRTGPLPGGPPGGSCAWPAANNGRGPGGSLETKDGYLYVTHYFELTSWATWWWWGHIRCWSWWLIGHHIFHHCHHRICHGITTLK